MWPEFIEARSSAIPRKGQVPTKPCRDGLLYKRKLVAKKERLGQFLPLADWLGQLCRILEVGFGIPTHRHAFHARHFSRAHGDCGRPPESIVLCVIPAHSQK